MEYEFEALEKSEIKVPLRQHMMKCNLQWRGRKCNKEEGKKKVEAKRKRVLGPTRNQTNLKIRAGM